VEISGVEPGLSNRGWGGRTDATGDCATDGETNGREEIEANSPSNCGDCSPYASGRDDRGIVGDGSLELNVERGC